MKISDAVAIARNARPDLPMVGVAVEQGLFSIVCFPNYGNGQRKDWHKGQQELAAGLTQAEAISALQDLAGEGAGA